MSTTTLPPIGSAWIHKTNPHDIVVVTGYNTIAPTGDKSIMNNIVKLHQVGHNTHTIEVTSIFTWHYKPLEQGEQR
jgi:hypothetical protein